MADKKPLVSSFRESFALLFRNYVIFLPYLISIAVSMAFLFLPFFHLLMESSVNESFVPPPGYYSSLVLFVMGSLLLSLVVYGWVFAAVRPVVMGGKLEILGEFRSGMRMAWTLFLQGLLAMGVAFVAAVVAIIAALGIRALYALSPWMGVSLGAVCIVLFVALLAVLSAYALQVGAVLIVERLGPVASLARAWSYAKENKALTARMFLLSVVLIAVSYAPSILFSLLAGEEKVVMLIQDEAIKYGLLTSLLSIPALLVMTALLIFYALVYRENLKPVSVAARPSSKRKKS